MAKIRLTVNHGHF